MTLCSISEIKIAVSDIYEALQNQVAENQQLKAENKQLKRKIADYWKMSQIESPLKLPK
jgi:cell division protein FtsB